MIKSYSEKLNLSIAKGKKGKYHLCFVFAKGSFWIKDVLGGLDFNIIFLSSLVIKSASVKTSASGQIFVKDSTTLSEPA
jgi:hypothetical protein